MRGGASRNCLRNADIRFDMFILALKEGESIVCVKPDGGKIVVTVIRLGKQAHIGFQAGPDVGIWRDRIWSGLHSVRPAGGGGMCVMGLDKGDAVALTLGPMSDSRGSAMAEAIANGKLICVTLWKREGDSVVKLGFQASRDIVIMLASKWGVEHDTSERYARTAL